MTICIILKRTARSPSTITVPIAQNNVCGVVDQGTSVLHMEVRFDIRTEPIHDCHTERGFRAPALCRYCRLVPSQWGSCQPEHCHRTSRQRPAQNMCHTNGFNKPLICELQRRVGVTPCSGAEIKSHHQYCRLDTTEMMVMSSRTS